MRETDDQQILRNWISNKNINLERDCYQGVIPKSVARAYLKEYCRFYKTQSLHREATAQERFYFNKMKSILSRKVSQQSITPQFTQSKLESTKLYQAGKEVKLTNPNDLSVTQLDVRAGDVDSHAERFTAASAYRAPPVDVVSMPDGKLRTLDHRRVAAAAKAKVPVKVVTHRHDEKLPNSQLNRFRDRKNSAKTWGEAAEYRINKHQKKWARDKLRSGRHQLTMREGRRDSFLKTLHYKNDHSSGGSRGERGGSGQVSHRTNLSRTTKFQRTQKKYQQSHQQSLVESQAKNRGAKLNRKMQTHLALERNKQQLKRSIRRENSNKQQRAQQSKAKATTANSNQQSGMPQSQEKLLEKQPRLMNNKQSFTYQQRLRMSIYHMQKQDRTRRQNQQKSHQQKVNQRKRQIQKQQLHQSQQRLNQLKRQQLMRNLRRNRQQQLRQRQLRRQQARQRQLRQRQLRQQQLRQQQLRQQQLRQQQLRQQQLRQQQLRQQQLRQQQLRQQQLRQQQLRTQQRLQQQRNMLMRQRQREMARQAEAARIRNAALMRSRAYTPYYASRRGC